MPLSPLRARVRSALAALVLAAPAGCETVRSTTAEPVDPTIRPDTLPRASEASLPPGKKPPHRCGNYVFYHDFEIDPSDPLFAELEALPDQVFGELALPPTNAIVQVFLFDTQDRYERYMRSHYPKLPPRRAYMIAEPRIGGSDELKVFTWMGDHLRTDLRHELTHALLHGVLKAVPLWLDEGIAGVFEQPASAAGVNLTHLEALRKPGFTPNLARLEKLGQVHQMEKPEYQEAWGWVHFMLHSTPANRKVLQDYLQALRQNPNPGGLLAKLEATAPDANKLLIDHLANLQMPALVVPVAAPR